MGVSSHSPGASVMLGPFEEALELGRVSADGGSVQCWSDVEGDVSDLFDDVEWSIPARCELGLVRVIERHLLQDSVTELEWGFGMLGVVDFFMFDLELASAIVGEGTSFAEASDW